MDCSSSQMEPTMPSPVWGLIMLRSVRNPGAALICGSTSRLKCSRFSSTLAGSMLMRVTMRGDPTSGDRLDSTTRSSKVSTFMSEANCAPASSRSLASALSLASRSASVSQIVNVPTNPLERSALMLRPL
jgi:hypothetical protein